MRSEGVLAALGLGAVEDGVFGDGWRRGRGPEIASIDPTTGEAIARVRQASVGDCDDVVADAARAFQAWRRVPAPVRGELVRRVGEALRAKKRALGALVALEVGKIRAEAEGEVTEMIDVADFAVGLSRQLYGLSMHS
jgi:aldehyde dehydrogenase (NAD+)